MLSNFADDARTCLALARQTAVELRSPQLGSEHLLLALLDRRFVDIHDYFVSRGVQPNELEASLRNDLPAGDHTSRTLPLSRPAAAVLRDAAKFVDAVGECRAFSLLIAITRDDSTGAHRVLRSFGLT